MQAYTRHNADLRILDRVRECRETFFLSLPLCLIANICVAIVLRSEV